MEMHKLLKLMPHLLLLVLAIHAHTSVSAVHLKPNSITGIDIDFPVWRRELRSGGGGSSGGGSGGGGGGRGSGGGSSGRGGSSSRGGSSGRGSGGGGAGNGGSSNSGSGGGGSGGNGNSGGSSGGGRSVGSGGDCLKHRGLIGTLLSIVFVSCLILIR